MSSNRLLWTLSKTPSELLTMMLGQTVDVKLSIFSLLNHSIDGEITKFNFIDAIERSYPEIFIDKPHGFLTPEYGDTNWDQFIGLFHEEFVSTLNHLFDISNPAIKVPPSLNNQFIAMSPTVESFRSIVLGFKSRIAFLTLLALQFGDKPIEFQYYRKNPLRVLRAEVTVKLTGSAADDEIQNGFCAALEPALKGAEFPGCSLSDFAFTVKPIETFW